MVVLFVDFSHDDDIIRDVGDRHYSEVQRHPGGRVSTKVSHVKLVVIFTSEDDMVDLLCNLTLRTFSEVPVRKKHPVV